MRLWQAHLWLELELGWARTPLPRVLLDAGRAALAESHGAAAVDGVSRRDVLSAFAEGVEARAQQAWKEGGARRRRLSRAAFALTMSGEALTSELPLGALGYTIDLALEERRVALMLGGPAQYAPLPRADGTHAPTTATRLAWRQLSAAGWTVVPIPWHEWDVLDSPLARRDYLTERVREATAEPAQAEQPEAMADSG